MSYLLNTNFSKQVLKIKNYQIKIMSKKEMRNFIKSLQKVIVHLVILGHFGFLESQVFYQTNMHHIHF